MSNPENKASIKLDKEEETFANFLAEKLNEHSKPMGQLELVAHIISKLPVTEALANAVFQEVVDYIAICLALDNSVEFTRLGLFKKESNSDVTFKPSKHLLQIARSTTKLKTEVAIKSRGIGNQA